MARISTKKQESQTTAQRLTAVVKTARDTMRKDKGLSWEAPGFEPTQTERTREWLFTCAHSIWGGTNEIQKNVIAKRVLGIPE